ncbi:MAG: ABC transporter substrate-binding protein, partial [Candidatus Thioglobus sp.]
NQLTAATTYSPQIMVFLVDQEISPLFDFEHIAASVLSASRINIGTEDANFFTNLLRKNIIKNLLAKLSQGRGNSFSFVSARPTAYGDILVKLNAKGYSRYGLDLDLHFHKNQSGKWQIFDVALGRDSLIDYYKKIVQIKVRRYGVYGMLGSI